MPVSREVKEKGIQEFDWWRARVRRIHGSSFGHFWCQAPRVWTLGKEFGQKENGNPNSCGEAEHFFNKILKIKSNKRTLIIYLNGLLARGVWAAASRLGRHSVKSPLYCQLKPDKPAS